MDRREDYRIRNDQGDNEVISGRIKMPIRLLHMPLYRPRTFRNREPAFSCDTLQQDKTTIKSTVETLSTVDTLPSEDETTVETLPLITKLLYGSQGGLV